jgi:oxygen-independent coproporphyrinogen III oxidase
MSILPAPTLGLYISIPFCRSKCTYCNFASGVYPASDHLRYVERIIEDITQARRWARQTGVFLPRQVDSVYFGGGTPTLLAPELLERLFAAMRAEFDIAAAAEITVECAPAQLSGETLAALAAMGMNRASLGVQSFIDSETRLCGRLHNRQKTMEDISRLRDAGITNLSVDLIAGLAGQTEASWNESLDLLISTGVPHASIYMLEVDEDSRLGREVLAGGNRYHASEVPDDDLVAQMYSVAIEKLGAAGLMQYEISNFSRSGYESRHNMRYWRREPYLGLGVDASSALYALEENERLMLRASSTEDINEYLQGSQQPQMQWLDRRQQHEEAWFLGLRMNAGVSVAALEAEFGGKMVAPALKVATRLAADGLVICTGDGVRLTARGQLLSNEVFQEFLQLEAAITG